MKFFLDNNLPPNWAGCLAACSSGQFDDKHVELVAHLRTKFDPETEDIAWIRQLGSEGDWSIISQDKFRKNRSGERLALKESGISVFILQPSWTTYEYWDKLAQIIKWWPKIVKQANTVEGVAMEVPWKLAGKFKQI